MALNLDKLSLWELAHRWHGYDPHGLGDPRKVPLEVKDTLRILAKEIADESLYSTWRLDREAELIPIKSAWWRKPPRLAVADYREEWDQCIRHNVIDRAFLESVEIPIWELEYWCKENQVPMPEFWVRSRGMRGNQFPLPGTAPFEDEVESGEGSELEGAEGHGVPVDEGPSAQRRAALARHKPVNQLKRECVRFWLQYPKLSQAQAAKRFLDQLPKQKRDLLSPDRGERTLAGALSEYHRKRERPWLEDFDPTSDPQT